MTSLPMADPVPAWIQNNECFWCDRKIGAPEDSALNIATGRVTHAGDCEQSLGLRQNAILMAIFSGKNLTFTESTHDDG